MAKQTEKQRETEYCKRGASSQYDDVDITHPVKARYAKPVLDVHRGNRFIEALPLPWEKEDAIRGYVKTLPGYRPEKVAEMTDLEKIMEIKQLYKVRFPLLYQQKLEYEFSTALVTSYEMRRSLKTDMDDTATVMIQNREVKAGSETRGDSADATTGGFSLTSFGGTGKSSTMSILTSHYPQVYIHDEEYGITVQIAYLVVNCATNKNLTQQLIRIGAAIDLALENTNHTYEDMIAKGRTHGPMLEIVRRLIEKFSIGIIIFDEIQLMDFKRTGDGSFDSLLTLANQTKVAIADIGTEEAADKMFHSLRTSRRVGAEINGGDYCADKAAFRDLVNMLFYYQWFNERVAVTDDIVDTLYDLTHGIIDQLITIYMRASLDYVQATNKPKVINGEYFKHIAKKYFRGMQQLLDKMDYDGVFEANKLLKEEMDEAVANMERAEQEKLLKETIPTLFDEQMLLENVTAAIQTVSDTPAYVIEEEFKKVMAKKGAKDKSEHEIIKAVNERVTKRAKPKASRSKSKPVDLTNINTDRRCV